MQTGKQDPAVFLWLNVPLEQAVIFWYRRRGYEWSSKQDWGSSSPCDAVGEDGRSQLTGNWSFGATATLGLVGLCSDSSLPLSLNQEPSIACTTIRILQHVQLFTVILWLRLTEDCSFIVLFSKQEARRNKIALRRELWAQQGYNWQKCSLVLSRWPGARSCFLTGF